MDAVEPRKEPVLFGVKPTSINERVETYLIQCILWDFNKMFPLNPQSARSRLLSHRHHKLLDILQIYGFSVERPFQTLRESLSDCTERLLVRRSLEHTPNMLLGPASQRGGCGGEEGLRHQDGKEGVTRVGIYMVPYYEAYPKSVWRSLLCGK